MGMPLNVSADVCEPPGGRARENRGNPHGNRHRTRHLLNQEFMQALLLHFRQHGKKAIEKVAREQPASYLKVLGLLVPREHKVQHSNPIKDLTDEQLEAMIAVGHLLTIPAFRDILNWRCAWALKVQRPACKPGKRPGMSGNWRQQPVRARRVAFPKLAIVAIIAGAALASACSQPSDSQQTATQQQAAADELARKEADEKAWADAEKTGTVAAY